MDHDGHLNAGLQRALLVGGMVAIAGRRTTFILFVLFALYLNGWLGHKPTEAQQQAKTDKVVGQLVGDPDWKVKQVKQSCDWLHHNDAAATTPQCVQWYHDKEESWDTFAGDRP